MWKEIKPKGLSPSATYCYKKYINLSIYIFFISIVYAERTKPKVFFWNII